MRLAIKIYTFAISPAQADLSPGPNDTNDDTNLLFAKSQPVLIGDDPAREAYGEHTFGNHSVSGNMPRTGYEIIKWDVAGRIHWPNSEKKQHVVLA